MIKVEEIKLAADSYESNLKKLMDKTTDALIIRNLFIPPNLTFYENQLKSLKNISKNVISHQNLTIYPLSYAVIHEKKELDTNNQLLKTFFEESKVANNNYDKILGKQTVGVLKNVLDAAFNDIQLLSKENLSFPMFNIRQMEPMESFAIEIHCENSFISQLNQTLKTFLIEQVDLENALSFYLVLNEPDTGGDLILFDKTWDEHPIAAGDLDEKTRKNEQLFFNSNTSIPHKRITLKKGDMVFFRAAQIWHCIDTIGGNSPRITVGGFVAKSLKNEEQYFFWS